MSKKCCKCKIDRPLELFGKLKGSKDGLRYDCKECRKQYRFENKNVINSKLSEYYNNNKETLLAKNKEYRDNHREEILKQRKEYREREEIREYNKKKAKEYLPIRKEQIRTRRKSDLQFQLREVLRSKIHKFLKSQPTSYAERIGCSLDTFMKWIEFRFDTTMNWDNFGKVWQIDHILPLNSFDMTNPTHTLICFHWSNLQPLSSYENRQKSDKIQLHQYFNNVINVFRFSNYIKEYSGCQVLNESLKWLRSKLRYGENPSYEDTNVSEIDNQQPSL